MMQTLPNILMYHTNNSNDQRHNLPTFLSTIIIISNTRHIPRFNAAIKTARTDNANRDDATSSRIKISRISFKLRQRMIAMENCKITGESCVN